MEYVDQKQSYLSRSIKENRMIRFILGLVIVLGAVGTLDIDPEANVLLQTALAGLGITLMYFGTEKMKQM